MAKTYNQIKKSVLGKNYDIKKNNEKTQKTYDEIKSGVKNGKYNFSLVKSELEKTIGLDTFQTDLSSVGKTIEDSYGGWQSQETLQNTRSSIESMQNRLSALKDYQRLFGAKESANDINKIQSSFTSALGDLDELSKQYGRYNSADEYKTDVEAFRKTYPNLNYNAVRKIENIVEESGELNRDELKQKVNSYIDTLNLSKEEYNDTTKYANVLTDAPRKPNDPLQGALHSVGYFGEKILAGGLGAVENIGDYTLSFLTNLGSKVTTGGVSEWLKDTSEFFLERESTPEIWSESIEKRYRVPDSVRYLGTTAEAMGNLTLPMITEAMTLGASPWGDIALGQQALSGGAKVLNAAKQATKASDIIFGLSAAGGAAKQGYDISGDVGNSLTYGALTGLGEVATEKIFGGFAGTDIGDSLIEFTVKNKNIRKLLNFGTEGLEEIIMSGADTYLQRATVDKEAATPTIKELGESGMQGVLLSLFMGAATYPISKHNKNKAIKELNAVTEGLNETIGNEDNKLAPLKLNATEEEIKQRQDEIKEKTLAYREEVERAFGANIKANDRVGELFDIASNPDMALAYDTYTRYANEGINADNVSDVQLGRLYTDAKLHAEKVIDSKNTTVEQREAAQKALDNLGVYAQHNVGARTGSAQNIDNKFLEDYDAESIVMMIESGLESAEDTEAYKLATEYKAKIKNYDALVEIVNKQMNGEELTAEETKMLADSKVKLSAKEIASLSDANDIAIRAEETNDIATQLVERGESEEIADLVARKMRGETLTTEEAEKVIGSEVALSVIAENSNAENSNEQLLETAKSMDKEKGALFVALYDGKTDIDAYTNAFNLAVAKAENNFGIKDLLEHKSVLSNEQVGKIYGEIRIKADQTKRLEFQKLSQRTANLKAYKGEIEDSVIDYNNTSAEGKVNWNEIKPERRKEITFVKGLAQATGMNLVVIKDGKEQGINGSYSISGNTITIDIFAEGRINANELIDAIIPTMSHELTHWMEKKSPVLFRKICDVVFPTLQRADGLTERERITKEINRTLAKEYKKKYESENEGKTISLDEAFKLVPKDVRMEAYEDSHRIEVARSEIVARACEDMLSRSKVGRELFDSLSEKEKKTLTDKIKDIIQNVKDWISNALGLYESTSYEAGVLRRFDEECDKLSALWDEMLKESVEVNQALEKSGAFEHKKSTSEGGVLYSERPFAEQVDEVLAGTFDRTTDVYVGKLPKILQDVGLNGDLPMLALASHIRKANKPKNTKKHQHGLTPEQIKSIPDKIAHPVMIMDSLDETKNSIVVVTDMLDVDKSPIVVSIKADGTGRYNSVEVDSNFLTGYYGRDGFVNFIKNNVDADTFLYINKEKATILETESSTSWLEQLKNYDFNIIIRKARANVNTKFSDRDSTGRELSKGQQEYFKDSVVRDENGNLLVMYQGASEDFTVFDRKKSSYANLYGRGFYFTKSENHASLYGNTRAYYLNIKHPVSTTETTITKPQLRKFLQAVIENEDYSFENYGYGATIDSVLSSIYGKSDFLMLNDVSQTAIGDLVGAIELFNEVNGTSYDGIVLSTETVTFNSEQAKLTSNLNPTKDKDMRFSMRENVEETKDLIAVHNLSPEKLLKTLKLGGLPMPSIAITRAREGYNNFGAISLVFGKETIDPQFMRSNKIYSGDAWTPTYPQIAYKLNTKAQEKIKKKIDGLVPSNIQSDLGGLHLDSHNMEYELNRHGDMVTSYRYNSAMKYAFLKDNNSDIELPTKEESLYRYGEVSNSAVISFAHKMVDGLKTVNSLLEQHSSKLMADTELINAIATVLNEETLSTVEENTDAYRQLVENPLFKHEDIDLDTVLGMLESARKYFHNNGKIGSKVDYKEARTLIDEKTDMAAYESWLKELFSDVIAKEGIRNNKDLYTPSGNRRSFEALHYEHTLENVIKAMKEEGTKGIGGFGGGNIFGASTTEYTSIEDVKSDAENRMQALPESKYEEIKKGFSDRFFELANSLPIHKDSFSAVDDAANMLIEAVLKFKTKSGMANYLRTESKGWANYSDYIVDDLVELVKDIRNMPVAYFEAKPQRAVGYDEIKAVIMPTQESYEDDLSEVKSELEKLGVPVLEYEYGDNNARLKALNSLEDVRFSDRDSEGVELTTEQIEFFKDSKVRDAEGNLRVMWHGTSSDFTVFDISKAGRNWGGDSRHGKGFYFASTKEEAQEWGKSSKTIKAYLNLKNPLDYTKPMPKNIAVEIDKYIEKKLASYDEKTFFITKEQYAENLQRHKEIYNKDASLFVDLFKYDDNGKMTDGIREFLSGLGYDGIISKDEVVAFYPEQIKLTTNKTPTKDTDIRYADRDDTTVYDRMGETERIKKENEKFKAEIERLNERLKIERKVTHGNYFNENQLGAVAGHLRNISKSNYDKVKLMKSLKDVYSFIAHSENLTWEEVFSKCYAIADAMLAEAKPEIIVDDYSKYLLREIRNSRISLDEEQKKEAQHHFGKNWNRYFMGKVIISNDGINIDTKWQEWSHMYPEIFDAEVNSQDMIAELYDIIGSLKEASETIAEYGYEEQKRWLANEIYNQYWNVSPIRTTADKYDKQIKRLNYEHRNAMKEYRDAYEKRIAEQGLADDMYYGKKLAAQKEKHSKELAEQKQRQKEMHKKLYAEIRERKDKEIALAKQHGREMMDRYKENAERKTRIQSITANSLSLNEMLIKNSKDKHIPEIMKGPVTSLLQAIDFSSKRMLEKGEPTKNDISLSKSLSKVKDMMAKATNAHEELVELYGHGLDEDIEKMVDSVDNIMRTVGDNEFIINKMTLEDLQTLDKVVKTIRHAVNKLNKFHTVHHARGIANLSQESISYLDSLGKGKIYDGIRGRSAKLLNWGNALPYYTFKRFGEGGMKVYEALQDGWDKFAFNTKKILDYANEAYTSKEVKEWSEEVKTFNILIPTNGYEALDENYEPQYQEVQLTVPQIMSMYCLNKREQARRHLFQGGIRVADIKTKKGEIISQSEGVIFTEKDVQDIFDSLTERQKEVADKLQEFMNTVCADWGNDVSMARFGYKAFGEENYFPIQSDKNNLAVNDETEQINSLFKLLNMSFTKSTDDKANNRIVISDIFDVFAQHTSDMAKYNALALPVLDAFKWYNYTEKQDIAEGTFKTSGVKQSIENAFGKDGQNYFTTFLKDINGQQEVSRDTLGKSFFTNAKIAAVGANLRVMLLQPTSYVRASAVIDNKYLTKALGHKPKIAKAETHCGIALWKSLGYYDTNIQRGLEAQIKHADTWKDKATDLSMKGAEIADKITWGYLWNACELEIRDTRKDLKVGSQEFYDAIAKRLREVIYATQVVDSTMTRSQMMRSSDGRDKFLTAFASEPTLSYNMLQDAYMGLQLDARRMGKKEAWKKNGKRMARIVLAYTMTNAVAALVESAFDALRDDEDEEMDAIAFMKYYFSNFASDMSITAKIPYIKEIHSILQGFSSSRTDTQWMDETVKALKGWYKFIAEGKGKPKTLIKYSIKGISDLSGLPFYNVYRDTMAALNKLDLFTEDDLNEMFGDFED